MTISALKKFQEIKRDYQSKKGFTLVELLVVIAVIAILAAIVVLVINPLELTRRSRDAARFTDLANLTQAINVAAQENVSGTGNFFCPSGTTSFPCNASSSPGTSTNRATDGSGWVKVNLAGQTSVTVPTLPVDPVNTGTNVYNYYGSDAVGNVGWEITTELESQQYTVTDNREASDGGDDNNIYETGSVLSLQ